MRTIDRLFFLTFSTIVCSCGTADQTDEQYVPPNQRDEPPAETACASKLDDVKCDAGTDADDASN